MATQGPLTKLYSSFLTNPTKEVLHAQAGLHYISSTGNSFQTAAAIVGHLAREALLYEKKEQKILSAVESDNAVVVEVSTTIEFKNGGGVLLPGLDDNFVADQTVYLPMVHIVQFEEQVIKQIRIYWEQGSVLKQLGVIGKTGRNWPIRTGDEQLKIVKNSVGAVAASTNEPRTESATSTRPSSKGSNQSGRESIQLFAPREIGTDEFFKPAAIAPRAGIKPPSRQLHEIVGEEDDTPPVAQTPKAGSKNAPRRTFFVGEDIDEVHSTPDRKYLTHPEKFKHFQFTDEPDDEADTPKVIAPKRQSMYGKPGSSWDFADFATPDKRPGKVHPKDARTFSWSDDEDSTPVKQQPKKPLPRKDAETHFDIVDETPKKSTESKPVYMRKDNETHFVLADDSPAHGAEKKAEIPAARKAAVKMMDANWDNNSSPLGQPKPVSSHGGINIGGDGMGGKKGSDRIWGFEDESPAQKAANGKGINIGGNGMGGRRGTEQSWAFEGEEEVEEAPVAAPTGKPKGINIAGNGMGGRKGTDLHWGFGDDIEEEEEVKKPAPSKQENVPVSKPNRIRKQSEVTADFWEF